VQIVVVGAGQAGLQTAGSLRARGFTGQIALVGDENTLPYQRPPLSKSYLGRSADAASLRLRAPLFYQRQRIDLRVGCRVEELDRASARVRLSTGDWLAYDGLVLALGAVHRQLDVPGADLKGVCSLRTVADADVLRAHLDERRRTIVVIGAGFVGLEFAAAARTAGHVVTVVEATSQALARAVSAPVAGHMVALHRERGTTVLVNRTVRALHPDADGRVSAVELTDATILPADLVLMGVGAVARTEVARRAGLALDNGIAVDSTLRTSDPQILAVGDCASFPSRRAGARVRLECVQNAVNQASFAAAQLCVAPDRQSEYDELPVFSSAQFGENLQIAGTSPTIDLTVAVGDTVGGHFSVLCYADGVLRSVQSVNQPVDHVAARRLLAGGGGPEPHEASRPDFALVEYARRADQFDQSRAALAKQGSARSTRGHS